MEYSQYTVPDADGTVDFDALDNLGVDVRYQPPPPAGEEEEVAGEDYDDEELRQLNRRSGKGAYIIMGTIAVLAIAALAAGSTILARNNRNRSIEAAEQSVPPPTPATNTYAPTFRGSNPLGRTYAPTFRGSDPLARTYAPTVTGTQGNITSLDGESSPASDPSDSSGSDSSGTDGPGSDGNPSTDGSTDFPSFSFVGDNGTDLLGDDIIDGSPTSSPGGDAVAGDSGGESDEDTEDAGGGESSGTNAEDGVSDGFTDGSIIGSDGAADEVTDEGGHLGADGCLREGETQVDICLPDVPLMPRAVSCCSGSMADDSLICTRGPTCYNAASYSDAVARCGSNEMRLCTVAELESGVCCNQGCNFDFRVQWTSDVCGINIGPSSTPEPMQTDSPSAETMSNVTDAPAVIWSSISSYAPTTGLSNGTATPPPSGSTPIIGTPQALPTRVPTRNPKVTTGPPTMSTERDPSAKPTPMPMDALVPPPTLPPSLSPLEAPTDVPTMTPSVSPSASLTFSPSSSLAPSASSYPTASPSVSPTLSPSSEPSASPSQDPTVSSQPSASPTASPSVSPTAVPSLHPTNSPSTLPSIEPTCTISIEVDFLTEENGNLDKTGYTLLSVAGSKSTTYLEVLSGDLKGSTSQNDIACVSKGAYIFTVDDDSGNCCGDNKGYYVVKVQGEEVVRSGPYFTSPNAYIIRTDYQPPTAQKELEWLNKHNDVREPFHTDNGVSFMQLVWSESLAQAAADRANAIAPTCGPGPTTKDPWGENVARTTFGGYNESFVTPDFVFDGWDDPVDHPLAFRQVMWRPTRYVGCASNITRMYEDGPYCYVSVCKYARPGNCNVKNETWLNQTLADYSKCGPPCADEGCF
ncbi:hypothetical protein ACHAXM_004802 [Skeletonema potamos]